MSAGNCHYCDFPPFVISVFLLESENVFDKAIIVFLYTINKCFKIDEFKETLPI